MRVFSTVFLLLVLLVPAVAVEAVQRAQVTCTAPAPGSGDAPTEYRIEREAGGSTGVWDATKATQLTVLSTTVAPVFVDRTALNGTAYRYRCIAANPVGPGAPSDPSQQITLIGVPGKAGVTVIIISEP